MQLLKVYSNKSNFRTVEFNETGLNFIVAKQKDPKNTDKSKTYNGVGKSLLVDIIHFCLGASKDSCKSFCKKLPDWEFYLDFSISGTKYTVKRTTNEANKIILDGEELNLIRFNKKIENMCFDIPDEIDFLSFRALISFFIRKNKAGYDKYDEPTKIFRNYQKIIYNAFLLGLDTFLAQKKYKLKKEKDRVEKLEKNFKNDDLLKEFFMGNKDVDLKIVDLEERIKKLEIDLKNYKVADDYYEVQKEADRIEKELFEINNQIILINNNLDKVHRSLEIETSDNHENLVKIYEESNVHFSKTIKKTLDDLEEFYEKLTTNRRKRLLEQKHRFENEIEKKAETAEKFGQKLDHLMQYLGDHQALDVFVVLSEKNAELKSESKRLKKYQKLESDYNEKLRDIKKELLEQSEKTDEYLEKIKHDINELRDYFRKLANQFYPTSVAGLSIKNDDGMNQNRYDIDAKIESDNSDGINSVKIFCYDMTILFKGQNHSVNFIFHDSRIFDGIDERQKAEMFRIVYDKFNNSNKQYIATVNQNQLKEIENNLNDDDYMKIISENIILTLTDDKDSEKLLGITIDI